MSLKWKQEHPEEYKVILRQGKWKHRGIKNPDGSFFKWTDWLVAYEKQEGKCKICNNGIDELHADHDHNTGLFRAILCEPCNNRVAMYETNQPHPLKDPIIIKTIKNYLGVQL